MSTILVDIDGTLTTSGTRPNTALIEALRAADESGDRVIVVSSRPISRLAETRVWLERNRVPHASVHLNDFSDRSGPNVALAFKKYKYERLIREYGRDVEYVIDDSADVRRMARGLGLEAFTAAEFIRAQGANEDRDQDPEPDREGYEPTAAMREEAERGLEWRREFGRGGTAIGVARARDISNGRRLSYETVTRMASYFARHEVDKQGEGYSRGEPGYPSAGRIAWALWGGDAGKTWAEAIIAEANKEE